jgi:hypothetical protein
MLKSYNIIHKIRANSLIYKSFLRFNNLFIRSDFSKVEYFCIFIGYPYSGHTIIGALLDAHPEIVISIEADVLALVEKGYPKRLIFNAILRNNKRFVKKLGASWLGYSYKVPFLSQGACDNIHVLGDKKGAKTTSRLIKNFELLNKLEEIVGKPLKIIHVVRNPLDNIASIILRAREKKRNCDEQFFMNRIDYYFGNALMNKTLIEKFPDKVMTVYHEDFIDQPINTLKKLLSFFDLESHNDYAEKCGRIVKKAPHLTRELVNWPEHYCDIVLEKMKFFPFFNRYCP